MINHIPEKVSIACGITILMRLLKKLLIGTDKKININFK